MSSPFLPDIASPERAALIVVDVQNDFMSGGPLACEQAEDILAPLNDLIAEHAFACIVATQDWHPANHLSFASQYPNKMPFDYIKLYDNDLTLWPDHCIQHSEGARLHQGIDWTQVDYTVRLGSDQHIDAYSAFRNKSGALDDVRSTGLTGWLQARGIESVYLCGLARDVALLWSAEDAVHAGFDTHFLWDLTRPITFDSDIAVRQRLREIGVHVHEHALPMHNHPHKVVPLKRFVQAPITKF